MSAPPLPMPRPGVSRIVCCGLLALMLAGRAESATVPDLYQVSVPLTERSERGQALAFQDAMRQILVRIIGRRDAGNDPSLAPLVNDARRYVQQFRVVGDKQFLAGFDGPRLERAVVESGQPVWGHERPATLVLLTTGESRNQALLSADSSGELKQAVVRGAALRGLPIVWPDSSRPVNIALLAGGAPNNLQAIADQYGADAVLAGGGSTALVHWTLIHRGESSQWRGSAEEGPQGAADWFARALAAESPGEGALVAISVSGVNDLRAYAAVTDYLQSLTLVRALSLDEIAGDNVLYRARVQGGSERLARAISLGGRLEPEGVSNGEAGAALTYRYRP